MNLEQAKNNVNYYYNSLKNSQSYWNNNYKDKVDNIAKRLKLSSSQKELAILLVKADLAGQAYMNSIGLTKDNVNEIASIRGNTKYFKILQTIADSRTVISDQCRSFKDKFFKIFNNYNNR